MSGYGYILNSEALICAECASNPIYKPHELELADKEGYPDGYTCAECGEVKE